MKVSIFENPAVTEDHAEIHCQSATDEILWAAGLLENPCETVENKRK